MKQFFEVVKFISELFLLLSNAACLFEVTALHLKPALLGPLPDFAEAVPGGARRSSDHCFFSLHLHYPCLRFGILTNSASAVQAFDSLSRLRLSSEERDYSTVF